MATSPSTHRLSNLAVVRFTGADALRFLQGQLTQDTDRLSAGTSLPGAYCTPQGRVLALLRLVLAGEAVLAVLPRDLASAVAERLRRFVLRARVQIEVAPEHEVAGCVAPDEATLRAMLPACPVQPDAVAHDGARVVIRLAGQRALAVGPRDSLPQPAGAGLAAWELAAIQQGEPVVGPSTTERWVPQMLNLDLVGAVSFSKGCYPGQEIVARTQHLGRIKRRMLRYGTATPLAALAGDSLFAGHEKAAEIVRLASLEGVTEILAVVSIEHGGKPLATATGEVLQPRSLPYEIPELDLR